MLPLWESQETKSTQSRAYMYSSPMDNKLLHFIKSSFCLKCGEGGFYCCGSRVKPKYNDSLGISTKAALRPHGCELPVARTGQHPTLHPGWKILPAKDRHLLKHQPV